MCDDMYYAMLAFGLVQQPSDWLEDTKKVLFVIFFYLFVIVPVGSMVSIVLKSET